MLQRASDAFDWHLDLASIARMWRGGCIIRSIFLNDIAAAFEAPDKPKHLLLAPYFREEIKTLLSGWKSLVAEAMKEELPVPAFSSALNYSIHSLLPICPLTLCKRSATTSARIHSNEKMSCADSSSMKTGQDTEAIRNLEHIMYNK